MQVPAPPNLSEAYPIAENKIRVIFDKNVDVTTAQNEANYTLGSGLSGSTVDDATLVGGAGTVVDLTVTEVLPRLDARVRSRPRTSARRSCPTCLSPQQSRTFILGVLTVRRAPGPAGGLARSPSRASTSPASRAAVRPWAPRLTVRGVVSGKQSGALTFLADAAGGLRSGVAAYNIPFATTVGHSSTCWPARRQEYYGMTELYDPVGHDRRGRGHGRRRPSCTDGRDADRPQLRREPGDLTNGEDYEGVLARVESVKVVAFNEPWTPPFSAGGSFRVVGPFPPCTDTIRIDGGSGTHFPTFTPVVGQWLNVNGFLYFTDDRDAQLWPRSESDIEVDRQRRARRASSRQVSLSVQPNPGMSHRVSFTVPSREKVELGVYDLLGRRLATLAKGEFPAGEYTRNWDGQTTNGMRVTSGVYFYKLNVGGEIRTFRAVKLN